MDISGCWMIFERFNVYMHYERALEFAFLLGWSSWFAF